MGISFPIGYTSIRRLNMRIIPVLDVMNGTVVRGVGGRRHEYRPIVSTFTSSCKPVAVARDFREHLGLAELYLADLDAIGGKPPAVALYQALRREGFALWADAGVRDVAMARSLAGAGVEFVVIGLETLRGPDDLAVACLELGERVVFSLDLRGGEPLGDTSAWPEQDAPGIAARAVGLGVRRLLVLDLARVGEGAGPGTEELCTTLSARYPALELAAGGGIRGLADLLRLQACGVGTALVASALHDRTLRREDLDGLRAPLDGR
jgi:phosphoribosylformimino-5-aminoimidazole carboxamide ribotide isomerase